MDIYFIDLQVNFFFIAPKWHQHLQWSQSLIVLFSFSLHSLNFRFCRWKHHTALQARPQGHVNLWQRWHPGEVDQAGRRWIPESRCVPFNGVTPEQLRELCGPHLLRRQRQQQRCSDNYLPVQGRCRNIPLRDHQWNDRHHPGGHLGSGKYFRGW